ncbi:EscR/YscR/HrcR family type III secretion system export apparatus protein [Parasedimentitalea maritima]|uniref:EscR/YscR/HrcR family type III secretion system export apparatus protein n=1 Tax=Parasedimentitalea maritima TaxID=2578117 RepID=A0ABY2UND5_9RHOB|nr:EscR/YscR/HrcR family type III secretion system export apparatus protein [Zongyanglinia marina]TLP55324.1 EscR/YscR/HrcR family type III secretion system export apparatus protein [Zongyanglinia marina]
MDTSPLLIGFAFGFSLFAFVSMTSFIKLSVVLMITRQALGMQQVPSNMIVMALAVFLSIFVAWPILNLAVSNAILVDIDVLSASSVQEIWTAVISPFHAFMTERIDPEQATYLALIATELWADAGIVGQETDLVIVIPSFMVSELTSAFEIGFLIYLPFVAIDLTVTGILMALGMQMVQPNIISVPFKLLVFVFVDGWSKLVEGLIMTYIG